jgi:hypothetical protein
MGHASDQTRTHLAEQQNSAQKKFLDYAYIPWLKITVTPIESESGGCAGSLEGKLEVDVEPTSIIVTKVEVAHPTVVIWVDDDTLTGPQQGFSEFMISRGERLIKKLVNSWTESQTLFLSIDEIKLLRMQRAQL